MRNARSAVIVGFDGLQPSQVTAERMPNLSAFAAEGVSLERHHSVFPTVTRTNVASMATGRYPGAHGLVGNYLVAREFDPHRAVLAAKAELGEVALATGRVLHAPHIAQVLAAGGREYMAVGIGSDGNSFLQNPHTESSGGATIHPEFCLPDNLHPEILDRFGPWPLKALPDEERMDRALRIMTEYVLSEREPAVSMLWICEPDSTQHAAGVDSPKAVRALELADRMFGRLMDWLRETSRYTETDVIVISDHGYSTSSDLVPVESLLRDAGFPAGGEPGGVLIAPNGGSVLFYTTDRDPATADRLAGWLMGQPWCGSVVASEAAGDIAGTIPASFVGLEGDRAPDLAISFAWDSRTNKNGAAGHVYSTGKERGLGDHGSMSRQELRCVLFARGPSFKSGVAIDTPSGNVDLAPTVLHNLGVRGAEGMDGRVLQEALLGGPEPDSVDRSQDETLAERPLSAGVYRQRITISRVGSTTYVDEGSARLERV